MRRRLENPCTPAEAGRLGGKATSAAKAAAAMQNGAAPQKNGKPRGSEKGRRPDCLASKTKYHTYRTDPQTGILTCIHCGKPKS